MKHQREHWASRLGFVMAAMGSAIGIGTLWKFPYVLGENGGGLFFIIYLACIIVVGIPVFIAELSLGRRAQRGVVGIFTTIEERHRWSFAGWIAVFSPLLILSFYNVVSGWGLNYVFMSLSQFYQGRSAAEIGAAFDTLYQSGDISIFFQFIFTLIVVGMVYRGVQKGIEYWARIMTIALLVLLICLLIYSVTLDGFGAAARFVLLPDVSKLRPSGVLQALGLAFFTLSVGQGVMLTYGSYMKRSANIPKTAFIVAIADVVVSLLAALMIFPVIFTFGLSPGQEEGLVFKTLPVLFSKLPASLVVSTAFFVLFVFTALTSAIALLEVIVANLIDLYGWSRKKASLISGLVVFILGLPCALSGTEGIFPGWKAMYGKNYFLTVDGLVNTWILPVGAFLTSIYAGWMVPRDKMRSEFPDDAPRWFSLWRFFVRWVVPIVILIIIAQDARLIDIDRIFGLKPSQAAVPF